VSEVEDRDEGPLSLPVFIRVGDLPECEVGTLTSPALGEFLRAVASVADECEGAPLESAIRELEAGMGAEPSAPDACPSCASPDPRERGPVPGATGRDVSCGDDWHREGAS
jgi:hypothetical protein